MMELVGVGYLDSGLTPAIGLDCYGLVRWVFNNELGMDLPERPPPATSWHRYVNIIRPPLPPLKKYDVIMFSDILPGLANHIGIMINSSDFIHSASAFGGVVCESITRYADRDIIVGIGRPYDS